MLLTNNRRNATKTKQNSLDVQEAYNLWDLTKTRYYFNDYLTLLGNFTHDKDFKYIIENYISTFQKEINILSEQLERYSIKGPSPNVKDINVTGNSEILLDEDVAKTLHTFLKQRVSELISILRDTTTNDHLRDLFISFLKTSIDQLYEYVKYLKLKGWVEIPPLYAYVQKDISERIAVNEVYHLWSHLNTRYLHIHQTDIYANFVYDTDFKALLISGSTALGQQATRIENALLHYGVTLPHRFTTIIPTMESTELYEDKYMFQIILEGMRNASVLHGAAIKECVLNDRIRHLFRELLYEEIDYINRFVKYGKLKGWICITPNY